MAAGPGSSPGDFHPSDSGPVRGESVTPWGYAAVAVGTVLAGSEAKKGAKGAAGKAEAGQAAAREEYRQYNQPFYDAGASALERLNRFAAGDFTGFQTSPDYQFAQQQGQEGLLRAAASRGSLNAGGTDADLLRFNQGLASQQYGNYLGSLQYLAGLGQSAAQGLGGSASQAASNIGQIRAGSAQQQADITGQTIGQLSNLFGQYQANRGSTYQQPVYQGQGSIGQFGSEPFAQYGSSFGGYNFGG